MFSRFIVAILSAFTLASDCLANVTGSDFTPFAPNMSEQIFTTVHSSKALSPGHFTLGAFGNYGTNTLPRYSDESEKRTLRVKDSLSIMDVGLGIGITHWLEMGIAAQILTSQSVADRGDRGEFFRRGLIDAKAYAKLKVISGRDSGVALILTRNEPFTEEDPYTGLGGKSSTTLEAAMNSSLGQLDLGLNLGYKFRGDREALSEYPILPVGDQAIASLAVSYLMPEENIRIGLEIYGSSPSGNDQHGIGRSKESAEAIITLRTSNVRGLNGFAGAGTEILNGVQTADLRGYMGVTYTLGQSERKVPEKKVKKKSPANSSKPVVRVEQIELDDIRFAFDSPVLLQVGSKKNIRKICSVLSRPSVFKAVVEGHADSLGNYAYNSRLGFDRATEIKNILMTECMLPHQLLEVSSLGEMAPIKKSLDGKSRQINRRVSIKVFSKS